MLKTTTILSILFALCNATKIVLTNDDGWAVAQIRAEYDALKAVGHEVILSAPAVNKSGSGSSSTTPTTLTSPCEFDSCPAGSPAIGSNSSDPNINYVNAFPVDAVRFGIQTLSPQTFDSPPDLVISGSNIGTNLALDVFFSGTIGAAAEAVLEGIPSVAFSGSSGSQVSYTTLTSDPTADSTIAAGIYTELIIKFISSLLNSPSPILPLGVSLNVNFASISSCPSTSSYKFVLTRIFPTLLSIDVDTCGSSKLPTESSAITQGCIATVSVFYAKTKLDADSTAQAAVLSKLSSILECL
ncbi:survival protein sure-like phosphatase/nucleotidase [Gymnopilus junonius]|uniref:Survival protein sure-like phosphatase/nucleotidase n=1 Tax=Gymnopilus junonius TaxID=109634 RepID=A0A9P5NAA2_GYMJU|nr:survival protein sure-like phosphatase/nucleotidase [Gymnopilus junonius]